MKRLLLTSIIIFVASIGFSDGMPSEVKRLKILRDKQVEEIDEAYSRELDKLKKKFAENGNYKAIVYIETMQGDVPFEVKRIKALRDKQAEEIDEAYFHELNKLKKKYTENGNYEAIAYIENMQISYIDSQAEKKKAGKRSTMKGLNPAVDSGAIISISTNAKVKIYPLKKGKPRLYDSDPLREIERVSEELEDWEFVSIPQRIINSYNIKVDKAGTLFCFGSSKTKPAMLFGRDTDKWELANGTIHGEMINMCYRRKCHKGEEIELNGFEIQIAAGEISIER